MGKPAHTFATSAATGHDTINARVVAEGRDWRIAEVVCRAGPQDRPFEERHNRVTMSAVVSGTFTYRAEQGHALLYPGALMLGNPGACFECGHEHGAGDRCLSVHLEPELFNEIAASAAGSARFRFSAAMMPAMPELLPNLVELEALSEAARPMAAETLVIRLAESVAQTMSGCSAALPAPSRGDARRISGVLRHIEENADQPLDLDGLAARAGLSKYHFLRTFRRVTGVTPYKFLLDLRMRRAGVRLATSDEPVAAVAFDAGFGDLSTFNNRFRQAFGMTPTKFRAPI